MTLFRILIWLVALAVLLPACGHLSDGGLRKQAVGMRLLALGAGLMLLQELARLVGGAGDRLIHLSVFGVGILIVAIGAVLIVSGGSQSPGAPPPGPHSHPQ